jgi:hypothetical protein
VPDVSAQEIKKKGWKPRPKSNNINVNCRTGISSALKIEIMARIFHEVMLLCNQKLHNLKLVPLHIVKASLSEIYININD